MSGSGTPVSMEDLILLKVAFNSIVTKSLTEKVMDLTWSLTEEQGEYEFDGVPFTQPNGYRVLAVRFLDKEPWN